MTGKFLARMRSLGASVGIVALGVASLAVAGVASTSASAAPVSPPTIDSEIVPTHIPLGGETALHFAIVNPNPSTTLTGVGFSDDLPSGVVVATPSNGLNGSCGGGAITAAPASSSITLSGATMGGGARCRFSLEVIGVVVGLHLNTTSQVTSNEGGLGNRTVTGVGVEKCPPGETAHLFTGTATTGSIIIGGFCVARNGRATYQQGAVSGSGGLTINGSSSSFVAFGPNLNLAGGTSGPTSLFTEVLPFKAQGTYTLR